MPIPKRLWLGFFLIAGLGLGIWLPLPIPSNMDFSMLYAADFGLRHGIGIYDHAGQLALLAQSVQIDVSRMVLPIFVYPPWYAWMTFYLGYLPAAAAARLWFFLSLGMILAASWLSNLAQLPASRLRRILLGLFWLPVLGLLVVGQYLAPLLLGLALLLDALKGKKACSAALGLALLTFKPHVGFLPFLAGLWILWRNRRSAWARRALWILSALLGALLLGSFLVQPDWPSAYWHALTGFRAQDTFGVCTQCAGLDILLARLLIGLPRMDWALTFGVGLAFGIAVWLIWRRAWTWRAERLVLMALLTGLLVNPYLMNYDYVLLLLPLWRRPRKMREILALIALPWFALPAGRLALNAVLALITLYFFGEVLIDDPA